MKPTVFPKLLLPVAFFGYAIAGNISIFSDGEGGFAELQFDLSGKVTQEIDTLYRDGLPHKEPAVGLIGALRYAVLDEGRKGVVTGTDGVLFTTEEFRAPQAEKSQKIYSAALAEITAISKSLQADGASLIVLPLPAKADILREQSKDPMVGSRLEAFYDQFLTDLQALDVATIDVRPSLVRHEAPFLATDTHWSGRGARAVAEYVANSGVIDLGETEFRVASSDEKVLFGDLVSYVTSEHMAPYVGLEPETIAVLTVEEIAEGTASLDGLDIFGGGASDSIDLVGTSYSANPNWSFVEALKLNLSRDVINHAQEGRGPVTPMRDYLDQRNRDEGAQTVIWEFPLRYLTDDTLLQGVVS